MKIESIYLRFPIILQNTACSLEGWRIQRSRYNKDFWRRLKKAEKRALLSTEEIEAKRDVDLSAFVQHAVASVPYYKRLFTQLKIEPTDIRKLSDLSSLPILTKQQVQENPAEFMSNIVPNRQRIESHTSGTTGAGLRFATTREALRQQYAIWWRYLRWHGLEPGTWCGYFGGRSIVPVKQCNPPFWRTNWPGRQVIFSAYHMNAQNLNSYLDKLKKIQPPWLHGYPSQLALIASHMIDTDYSLGYRPRWVTIASESLLDHHRTLLKEAFGIDPIQHYGMTEAVANISQCHHDRLHVDEDFAAVEFIPVGDEGLYKIVGTNFSNFATPLLRYDVGDHVRLSDEGCDCGLPGRIIKSVDGRQEAYVELGNGVRVGRLDHIFKDLVNVREAQIYQSVAGAIEVRIVKGVNYRESDEVDLLREIRSRLGHDLRIAVNYVKQIEKTRSGKLRFVVSDLQRNQLPA